MEPAGLAIGIAGLAFQLAGVSQECYTIFSEMKEIGYAQDSVLHDLRMEGLRLKQWEEAWGLHDTSNQRNKRLDRSNEQHRYAVANLARIVAVFTKIAELQGRYQGKTGKSRKRYSLGVEHLFSKMRSRSPSPGRQGGPVTSPSCQPPIISTLNSGDLSLLENPKMLTNTELVPGLDEEIASLHRITQNMQQSVSTFRKLRWVSTDKAKCDELVGQLKKYIDYLYNFLPLSATIPSISQTISLDLSFNIPFNLPDIRRNADFVGREALLEQLKQEIEKGEAIMDIIQVVLHGMGGMGKTQLAMEYVYRHSGDYSSVFWINAASEQTTKTSFTHIMQRLIKHHAKLSGPEPDYRHIGQLLGMAGKLDSTGMFTVQQPSEEQHIVGAVKDWLTAKGNTKWLLVFDNVDDLESFDINDYIPSTPHGTVIITSRRPESIQGRRGLEVQQMTNSEAEELLLKSAKLNLPSDECECEKEAASTIVHKLGYLPLAIEQAGAYIHIRQYSFSRYLREYNTNITYHLSKKGKVGKNDRSVFAAWDLSFNAIQNQSPEAADLLLLCGFLDNNDICEELLRRGMKLPINDTSLGDLLQILFSYSMIKRKDSVDSFNIHPLVHVWAQWKLEMEPERHYKKVIEAILLVASAVDIPMGRQRVVDDWIFERRILPHIFAIEWQIKTLVMENKEMLEAAYILYNVYMVHGYYKKAEEICKVALAGYEKLLGADNPATLTMIHNLAWVFDNQGQYSRALELYERVLAAGEKALGSDHPSTLDTVHNMALVFYKQGQFSRALEFLERVLTGREKALGSDHPNTLDTVNNMALVLGNQGQYSKALELHERVLAAREKALGSDHPSTLDTVHNMALVFDKQGQHSRALEFLERVLAGGEKALGSDHPNTLDTVNNMALVLDNQGQYSKALELHERVLAAREKALGSDHPSTLNTVHNMARVFGQQGQHSKALELHERVLAGREKALGADHPNTLGTVHSIAVVFHNQGQHSKALELYERALSGQEKALGADHPDTLRIVSNMAILFEAIGQSDKARELRERASRGNSTNASI
ncbi:hypothetical protein BDZ91DRAFT_369807 [Kalaharituber pfeilii]|nr:hypothetical protein BDZ91DRAFT_369807 [Kalaharituber pfeilii]